MGSTRFLEATEIPFLLSETEVEVCASCVEGCNMLFFHSSSYAGNLRYWILECLLLFPPLSCSSPFRKGRWILKDHSVIAMISISVYLTALVRVIVTDMGIFLNVFVFWRQRSCTQTSSCKLLRGVQTAKFSSDSCHKPLLDDFFSPQLLLELF